MLTQKTYPLFVKSQAIIFLLFFVLPFSVNAQKFKAGVDIGATRSILSSDLSNLRDTRYNVKTGLSTNLFVEYNFYGDFVVRTGIGLAQKAYEYQKTSGMSPTRELFRPSMLQLPLSVGWYLIHNPIKEKGLWLKVQGGAFYEFFARLYTEGEYPVLTELQLDGSFPIESLSEVYDFKANMNHFNRNLWGVAGAVEMGYSFGKFDLYASFTVQSELTDTYQAQTVANIQSRLLSYLFSLGTAYKF